MNSTQNTSEQIKVGTKVNTRYGLGVIKRITARYYHIRLTETGQHIRLRSPQFTEVA